MDNQNIFRTDNWATQENATWESDVDTNIYGHRFSIVSRPTAFFISQNHSLLPELVFGIGIIFYCLFRRSPI